MFDGPTSLLFSCCCWHVGRERLWWWVHPLRWLSSISLLPRLPGFPPQAFHTTVSSLTTPQSVSLQSTAALSLDCSTIPKPQLPATSLSRGPVSLSRVCMAAARTVWFSFHLGCHWSAVSLSALNVSSLTQTGLLLQFPHLLRAGLVVLTLLFFLIVPLSYQVLPGSIYSFPLVRFSCPLSAGVLHDCGFFLITILSLLSYGEIQIPIPCRSFSEMNLAVCIQCHKKYSFLIYTK